MKLLNILLLVVSACFFTGCTSIQRGFGKTDILVVRLESSNDRVPSNAYYQIYGFRYGVPKGYYLKIEDGFSGPDGEFSVQLPIHNSYSIRIGDPHSITGEWHGFEGIQRNHISKEKPLVIHVRWRERPAFL